MATEWPGGPTHGLGSRQQGSHEPFVVHQRSYEQALALVAR